MAKLILISIIFSTVAIPVVASRDTNPVRGMKKVILYALLFHAVYLLSVLLVYPRVL
jgi:hypothetical protein